MLSNLQYFPAGGGGGGGGGSGFTWRGVWSDSTEYVENDLVHYQGSVYLAIETSTNQVPNESPSYWSLFAAGLTYRGSWDNATEYYINDIVEHDGSSYIGLQTGTNQEPGVETSYWGLIAEKGDTGENGEDGGSLAVTIQSSNYTASAGDLVYCDTSSGAFTVTLPHSAPVDTVIGVVLGVDGQPLTVSAESNGSPTINSKDASAQSVILHHAGEYLQFQKANVSDDWVVISDSRRDYDLIPAGTKTGNYTLRPGEHVIANADGGGFTLTLPTTPPLGTRVGVSIAGTVFGAIVIDGGSAAIRGQTATGATTLTVSILSGIYFEFQYIDTNLWVTTSELSVKSVFQTFVSSGTFVKNPSAVLIDVLCIGGGGGGASGTKGATGTHRGGGGGGGGGGFSRRIFRGDQLDSSITITVGEGGSGGAARTTNDTAGQNGSAGGTSSFGGYLKAGGGAGGDGFTGGTNSSTQASQLGGNGGTTTIAGSGTNEQAAGGGGGGGRITSGNVVELGGAGGSTGLAYMPTPTPGGAAGPSSGSNGSAGTTISSNMWQGGGGGGGGAYGTGGNNAGNGGNGGGRGGGGGGGGGVTNGSGNSGAGGAGADGLVLVIQYF